MMKRKYMFTKENLEDDYIRKQKSIPMMAKERGCSRTPIYAAFQYFRIPIRTKSESLLLPRNRKAHSKCARKYLRRPDVQVRAHSTFRKRMAEKRRLLTPEEIEGRKERYKETRRKYNESGRRAELYRKYSGERPKELWIKASIRNHRLNGFDVRIDWDFILKLAEETDYCPICNEKLDYERKWPVPMNKAEIDRVNDDDYLDEATTQIICRRCNIIKSNIERGFRCRRTNETFIN